VKTQLSWLVVALLIGFAWLKAHDGQVRANALAEARADSLALVLDSVAARDTRLARADSQLARHEAADRARLAASRAALAVASRRADSTGQVLDSVLRVLPDTAPLAIAITDERRLRVSCTVAVEDCGALNLTLTARTDTLEASIAELRPALERTKEMWQQAEQRSRPGFLGRLRIALPWMAGTAVAVVVLRDIF